MNKGIFTKNFGTKILCSILLSFLIIPTTVFAHVEPIETPTLYNQQVFIKSVSIDDDDNFWGPADVFFDYIVDAVAPPHDEQSGVTKDTVTMSSGDSVTFDPPIEIYGHETCHCEEEFDIDIAVFDYAPIQHGLINIFMKGLEYAKSYVTGGTTGVIINVVGDIIEKIIDSINEEDLSEEDKKYLAYVKLIEDSDHLGSMREIVDTPCEPSDESYTADISIEEIVNGTLTYQIVKTPTEKLCKLEEPKKITPKPEPTPEPTPEPEPEISEPEKKINEEEVDTSSKKEDVEEDIDTTEEVIEENTDITEEVVPSDTKEKPNEEEEIPAESDKTQEPDKSDYEIPPEDTDADTKDSDVTTKK